MAEPKDEYDEALDRFQPSTVTAQLAEPDEYDVALAKLSSSTAATDKPLTWDERVQRGRENNLRQRKQTVQTIVSGAQNTLGLPGTVEAIGNKFLPEFMTRPVNSFFDPTLSKEPQKVFPTGEDIAKSTGQGMENHPELAAQNAPERYSMAAYGSLPSAVLSAPLGPAMALSTTVSGALAAQAAHDFDPDNHWLPIVAGIIGSGGAGWATSAIKTRLANSAANTEYKDALKAVDELDKKLFAAKDPDLAVKPPGLSEAENQLAAAKEAQFKAQHPGEIPPESDNQLALRVAQDARFAGQRQATVIADQAKGAARAEMDATKKLTDEAVAAVDKAAAQTFESTASGVGKATTLQEAGESLQNAARNWVEKEMPKKLAAASKDLDAAVPGTAPTQIDNYRSVLEKLNKVDDPVIQSQLDILGSPTSKALQKKLSGQEELQELAGEVTSTPPTWAGVRTLRSRLGDAMANPSLMKGLDQSEISALYSALTQDLGAAAKAHGAGDLWTEFNKESSRLYSVRDGVMSKLISTKNADKEIKLTPEQAAAAMVGAARKGGTELAALRQEIPDAVNDLASFQLRNPGHWGKLQPEAKAALLPDGSKVKTLDDMVAAQARAAEAAKAQFKSANQKYTDTVTAANLGAKEGKFDLLRAVRKEQKAVDAERRVVVAREAAEDAARAKVLKDAQEAVKTEREAAALAEKKLNYSNEGATRAAKERVKVAEAGLPAKAPTLTEQFHRYKWAIGAGAALGNELLPGIMHSLQLGPTQIGTGLAVGAMAVPPLWNAAKATAKNPLLLGIPATGVVSGQNALSFPRAGNSR